MCSSAAAYTTAIVTVTVSAAEAAVADSVLLAKAIKNSSSSSKTKSEVKPAPKTKEKTVKNEDYKSLPENVKSSYDKYNEDGWNGNVSGQTVGTKAGGTYQNRDRKLPTTDSSGNSIKYKEYDVNNKIAGQSRDAERFVRGSDGSVYYTNDHYSTFTKVN